MTTVKNIYDYLNSIAPFDTQEEWDNSGFLIGDFRKEVKCAVLSLDATLDAVNYAKSVNADLLITHHPVIFGGIDCVQKGSAVYELVKNNIAQISTHTCFDKANEGIAKKMAEILLLEDVELIDGGNIAVGNLNCEMSIDDLAELASTLFESDKTTFTNTDKIIKRVATAGGASGDFTTLAFENADCFVLGEMKYHEMLDCAERGEAVLCLGHFESENKPFLKLKDKLEQLFTDVEFLTPPERKYIIGL